MAYTVLARRYRSQRFDDVVGQDATAQTLKNAIRTGKVAHAYLFTGTRGVGKTTMARILAKSLNCLKSDDPTPEPCCKCDSCTAINTGDDIDVIEIDGASHTGVDNIRQLRQNAIYRPARARYKIYIIDEVHMLSTGAFNALLKILEEPPEHVKFIFATTEPNKVLATIQSRCQRFDFSAINPAKIAEQLKYILKKEKIKSDQGLILRLARLANGSMRDALSLLDQLISTGTEPLTLEVLEEFLGEPNRQKIYDLIDKIGDKDAGGILVTIDELLKIGQSPVQIIDSLIDCTRDLMVIKSTNKGSELLLLTPEEQEKMSVLAEKFDVSGLIYNITVLEKLRWTCKSSDSPRALLEATMLRLGLSEHFLGVSELLERLDGSARPSSGQTVKKKSGVKTPPIKPTTGTIENSGKSKSHRFVPDPKNLLGDRVDIESIRDNWLEILTAAEKENATAAGWLKCAEPAEFAEGVLKLSFPQSAEFARSMCQKRCEQIQALLSTVLGTEIKVKFETGPDKETKPSRAPGARTNQKQRNEALNDPAVKTLLDGLDATVTQIDQIKDDT